MAPYARCSSGSGITRTSGRCGIANALIISVSPSGQGADVCINIDAAADAMHSGNCSLSRLWMQSQFARPAKACTHQRTH